LAFFFAIDSLIGRPSPPTFAPLPTRDEAGNLMEAELKGPPGLRLRGGLGLACLGLMILGVFLDPLLKGFAGVEGFPVGATFQILVAVVAYRNCPREILAENDFSFGPVKEVGLLFLGIFLTMTPALAFLSAHGASLGLSSPTAFYFGTGTLSAVLDNAPTYANFLQIAFGAEPITPQTIAAFLARPGGARILIAISTGAVFFGAMTYIGNGPNFMVKAIAESEGVKMPSFFGFIGLACVILLPILVLHWAVLIR
jgi:Na+/H+ antiporter NhaD/arsenite permease-like protein